MNKRKLGAEVELKIRDYLVQHGFEILEMNYRCRQGEVDIIAKEDSYYVFVEVKYRSPSKRYGTPQEAVGFAKQKRICQTAQYYLYSRGLSEFTPVRFDVAGVLGEEITYLKNAFAWCL